MCILSQKSSKEDHSGRSRSGSGDQPSRPRGRREKPRSPGYDPSTRHGVDRDGYGPHPGLYPSRHSADYRSSRSRGGSHSNARNSPTTSGNHSHNRDRPSDRNRGHNPSGASRAARDTGGPRTGSGPRRRDHQRSSAHEPLIPMTSTKHRTSRPDASWPHQDPPPRVRVTSRAADLPPTRASVPQSFGGRGRRSHVQGQRSGESAPSRRKGQTKPNDSVLETTDKTDSQPVNKLPMDFYAGYSSRLEREVTWETLKSDFAGAYPPEEFPFMHNILRELTENQRVEAIRHKFGLLDEFSKRYDADLDYSKADWEQKIFPTIAQGNYRAGQYISSLLSGDRLAQAKYLENKNGEPFYTTAWKRTTRRFKKEIREVWPRGVDPLEDGSADADKEALQSEWDRTERLRSKYGPEHLAFELARQRGVPLRAG